jgi:hypothetical protein
MSVTKLFVSLSCVVCALVLRLHVTEAGSVYTRWGRTTCEEGATAVYKGYVAGNMYDKDGSGGNYLCVREGPQWGSGNVGGTQEVSGKLHGIQYRFWTEHGYGNNKPFSYANNQGASLNERDAVCVVCYRPNSSTNLMIPGGQDCGVGNDDWNLEYKGYLMSERLAHQRAEYICVDEAPEARPRVGAAAANIGTIHPVQVACGGLPCGEYKDGNEVTCAVCSK